MAPTIGIIGAGGIAQALEKEVLKEGWSVEWMKSRSQGRITRHVDLVFNAISTLDSGQAATRYTLPFLTRGIPVTTCEKGSWAYYPKELFPYKELIGYQAACGGGSELLRHLSTEVLVHESTLIETVINASMHFLFSPVGNVVSPQKQLRPAKELFLVEPEADGLLRTINGEIEDAMRKACVLFNTTLSCDLFITPKQFFRQPFTRSDLERMRKDNFHYRFVVLFTNYKDGFGDQMWPGEFRAQCADWKISGGFGYTLGEEFWLPDGPMNGYRIISAFREKPEMYAGLGAGHASTVGAMMNDAKRLLRV
jgi:homoserine dehydrogenase